MDLPNPREEDIIVDGCTCGKSRLLMKKQRYYSDNTSDIKRRGTMQDYGAAWVDLLDGYILEIDGTNDTIPYRRSATSIVKQFSMTDKEKGDRRKSLDILAKCHPGLYEVIRIIVKKEEIEPIEIPLKRLDLRSKRKRLDGLKRERERRLQDLERLDKDIEKATI
jgi:hypothetical protein